MKIGEALRNLSQMKSQLVRLIELRNSTFIYSKKEQPDPPYSDITNEIRELMGKIDQLKLQIDYTNYHITTIWDGKPILIGEIILKIGDIKSELKQIANLPKSHQRRFSFDSDREENDQKPQLTASELHKIIEDLESHKNQLDKKLQYLNWKVELIEVLKDDNTLTIE